jgi:GTPase Era involved in 16S rRNA processing
MFVAGETWQPDTETTTMVENIVREQAMHMVRVNIPPPPKT